MFKMDEPRFSTKQIINLKKIRNFTRMIQVQAAKLLPFYRTDKKNLVYYITN